MAELLEAHDRSRFELFAFSFGPDKQDPMRERVAAAVDHASRAVSQAAGLVHIASTAMDAAGGDPGGVSAYGTQCYRNAQMSPWGPARMSPLGSGA